MCVSVAGSRMMCGPWVIPGVSACTRCWQLTQLQASNSATSASCGDPSLIVSTPPKPATHAISLAAAVAAGLHVDDRAAALLASKSEARGSKLAAMERELAAARGDLERARGDAAAAKARYSVLEGDVKKLKASARAPL